MTSEKKQRQAADKITAIINSGFVLSLPNLHFIESSFSVATANELNQLIAADDGDLDVIFELVVSPDKIIQADLELFLNDACFSNDDEKYISEALCKKNLESKIIFPENKASVSIVIDDYIIKRFITKLRITRNPDKLLYTATDALSKGIKLNTLVRIRNSSISYNESLIEFFVEFIHQKSIKERDFPGLFDFAVSTIEENTGTSGIMEMFIKKKRSYEKTLDTIKRVNKQLKTATMETMMMQGTRVPPASENEIEIKIGMAETILAVLFGYTDRPGEKPSEIDLGRISDKKDIKKVFRILS